MSGTCTWDKNPAKAANGASPNGVSLTNAYGRCGSLSNAALPASAYTSTPSSSWPISTAGEYTVKTNVTCTPALEQKSCPTLTVIDGADYMIECNDGIAAADCKNKNKATLKVDECVEITVKWTNTYDLPNVIMRCEASNNTGSISYILALNGTARPAVTGDYSAQTQVPLGKIKVGDNEFGSLCLKSASGVSEVRCEIAR